jgi:predicted TIM-barrel fold metal-dependent hydrolase
MRIDINAFFGHWPYWPLLHPRPEDLLRQMDRYSIDRAAVASLRGLHGDWHEANAETLRVTRAHADRFIPVACMSPMKGGGSAALRELVENGFRALRLYPLLLQGYRLRSPFADDVAAAAGKAGITLIVPTRPMMNFRFPALPVDEVADLSRRHPRTQVVLSGPNYLSEFQSAIEALQACANLSIEVSCMQGLQAVARMVGAVGADRVVWGTGMPLHAPACGVAKLEHADITAEHLEAVAWQNTERLLTAR